MSEWLTECAPTGPPFLFPARPVFDFVISISVCSLAVRRTNNDDDELDDHDNKLSLAFDRTGWLAFIRSAPGTYGGLAFEVVATIPLATSSIEGFGLGAPTPTD